MHHCRPALLQLPATTTIIVYACISAKVFQRRMYMLLQQQPLLTLKNSAQTETTTVGAQQTMPLEAITAMAGQTI